MKGRQLVCIRMPKNRTVSCYENSIGYVKGISEEILSISPRDKKLRNQLYLKSISPTTLLHKPLGSEESSMGESFENQSIENRASLDMSKEPERKKDKIFKLDVNSKFSMHFHVLQGKELEKLSKELFPKELEESIAYVPDYEPSCIIQKIELQPTNRAVSQGHRYEYNTVGNLVKSAKKSRNINMNRLKNSQFTTYSTGWGSFYSRTPVKLPRQKLGNMKHLLPEITKQS